MVNPTQIKPNMPVVCSNATQFATVERMEGNDWIRLRNDDKGTPHYIPFSWVQAVDDRVHVDRPSKQAVMQWSTTPSFDGMKSSQRISTRDVTTQPQPPRKNNDW